MYTTSRGEYIRNERHGPGARRMADGGVRQPTAVRPPRDPTPAEAPTLPRSADNPPGPTPILTPTLIDTYPSHGPWLPCDGVALTLGWG